MSNGITEEVQKSLADGSQINSPWLGTIAQRKDRYEENHFMIDKDIVNKF